MDILPILSEKAHHCTKIAVSQQPTANQPKEIADIESQISHPFYGFGIVPVSVCDNAEINQTKTFQTFHPHHYMTAVE